MDLLGFDRARDIARQIHGMEEEQAGPEKGPELPPERILERQGTRARNALIKALHNNDIEHSLLIKLCNMAGIDFDNDAHDDDASQNPIQHRGGSLTQQHLVPRESIPIPFGRPRR